MITPEEITKRALRKYHDILRGWLNHEDFCTIEFPVGAISKDLSTRRREIEQLREKSGAGYSLEWITVNNQSLGKQTHPYRVIIASLDDYLTLTRKRIEFNAFTADVEKIRYKFPVLEGWIYTNPQAVIDYHGKWDDLLTVCDYFVKNPRPNQYIRELSIPVHTKFIELHNRILWELFENVLPIETIDTSAQEFNTRFGLKSKPVTIRIRLLEEQLDWHYRMRIDDLSLPIDQLAHLLRDHIKPHHIIIVENLINFLTLPPLPNSIGLFGSGFAVHLLRDVDWLSQCDVLCWGDIDAHGFQILSDLRGIFPHTRSVMMDQETFDLYSQYAVEGKLTPSEEFVNLTEAETRLAREVFKHNWRLEQEHLPQEYAVGKLRSALSRPMR